MSAHPAFPSNTEMPVQFQPRPLGTDVVSDTSVPNSQTPLPLTTTAEDFTHSNNTTFTPTQLPLTHDTSMGAPTHTPSTRLSTRSWVPPRGNPMQYVSSPFSISRHRTFATPPSSINSGQSATISPGIQPAIRTTTTHLTRQITARIPVRTKIPWKTKGVEKLAVETVLHIRIWDPSMQDELQGKIMCTYKAGVRMFVEGLQVKIFIKLKKEPIYMACNSKSSHQDSDETSSVQK